MNFVAPGSNVRIFDLLLPLFRDFISTVKVIILLSLVFVRIASFGHR